MLESAGECWGVFEPDELDESDEPENVFDEPNEPETVFDELDEPDEHNHRHKHTATAAYAFVWGLGWLPGLESAGECWRLLESAGECWRML